MTDALAVETSVSNSKGRRLAGPMALFVFLGVLAAVAIPLVIVYALLVGVALSNTNELVRDKAAIIVSAVEDHVTGYLDPIPEQIDEVAELLDARGLTINDSEALDDLFQAALAATPQVATLSYAGADGQVLRVYRDRETDRVLFDDWSDDPAFMATLETFADAATPGWDGIFIAEAVNRPFINYVFPLYGETFHGVLIASVSLEELSRYLLTFEKGFLGTPFLLRGADNVLAHPQLPDLYEELTDAAPLPRLDEIGDPELAGMWRGELDGDHMNRFSGSVSARVVELNGETEVFLYRPLHGYDTATWYVATHLPLSTIAPQLDRLDILSTAALAAIICAFAISLLLSHMLTRPIRRLAAAMRQIAELQFDRPQESMRSAFVEVEDAMAACDHARRSLRTFGRYVPRKLVRKLLDGDHTGRMPGTQSDITVLFTDIMGFTAMSERMSAVELEEFLNEHFALLDACIEANDGTTDKYIGDSLMAFWGAPERQDDQALRACQAAAAIARVIRDNNDVRERNGLDRVQLRIGIHSGPVVVGDIGSDGRVNYTVVGDSVNIAERLEELARHVPHGNGDVVAVISQETANRAGGELPTYSLGQHVLHGRRGRIEALVLDLDRMSSA